MSTTTSDTAAGPARQSQEQQQPQQEAVEEWSCPCCQMPNVPSAHSTTPLICMKCAAPHPSARMTPAVIAESIAKTRAYYNADRNDAKKWIGLDRDPSKLHDFAASPRVLVCPIINATTRPAETSLNPWQYKWPVAGSRRVRIVMISDTHTKHHRSPFTARELPYGDVLIHSGDFHNKVTRENMSSVLDDFNYWWSTQPHPIKILVCGNHELRLPTLTREQIQERLPAVTHYLEDSTASLYDGRLMIYGTPWNTSGGGYGLDLNGRAEKYAAIPHGTHVLVTHQPPFNILDLAWERKDRQSPDGCKICHKKHPNFEHWGCTALRHHVTKRLNLPATAGAAGDKKSAPAGSGGATDKKQSADGGVLRLHQFGHVHDAHGVTFESGVMCVNAAQDLAKQPIIVDYWIDGDDAATGTSGSAGASASKPPATAPGTDKAKSDCCIA